MSRSMIYSGPLGPAVRIGVLQHQKTLRVDRIGRYILRHPSGTVLGKINPDDGPVEIRLLEGKSARMGWRLVVNKAATRLDAEQFIARERRNFRNLHLEILVVGHDFDPYGMPVTSREFWVVSQVFAEAAKANASRDAQPHPGRISLLEVRLDPPEGTLEVSIGGRHAIQLPSFVRIEPVDEGPHRVILHDVIVGVGFHWQHVESQKLRGVLEARIDNRGMLTAISELPLEHYLYSVNSSEMMSQCPMSLLEAQTIAARNTILATMDKHHHADDFDVCADDHCQCYRGSSRETDLSRQAVLNTLGEVLCHQQRVCDCRYSKICGGISENFDSCWEGDPVPYMVAVWDGEPGGKEESEMMPADAEAHAAAMIRSTPDVYCNTQTYPDVPQYLRYSAKYFRWQVEFTREEFEASLNRFPAYQVGELRDIQVLKRGVSGRIEKARVVGSERSVVIHREYYIREAFAPFFLYSACFIPTLERDASGRVTRVILDGGGWGHGAGLCQIGASMMAHRGKSCGDILAHYYKGTRIARLFGLGADILSILRRERRVGDLRIGDRCYEYYNCYAVARCPVYHENIHLRARTNEAGKVEFLQECTGCEPVDLEGKKIACEFLTFRGKVAAPKPGVK